MNLKNYTSGVSAERSINKIEAKIVSMGASNITKTYDGGALSGISFEIKINGIIIPFQLPANVHGVYQEMMSRVLRPASGTKQRVLEQAERTAWKIISDWVDCQASMIYLQQVKVLQVFLPFVMLPSGKSVYSALESGDFKALNQGK